MNNTAMAKGYHLHNRNYRQGEDRQEEKPFWKGMRAVLRLKHYSYSTEKTYIHWSKAFILFHGKKHPKEMGVKEVQAFLSYLAVAKKVSASTQNQAFNAVLFMYREYLKIELTDVQAVRAKRRQTVPVVFTMQEISAIMDHLRGIYWLMAALMYGSGLRLMECCRLRVKDIDFGLHHIAVRDGKGGKDRIVPLPAACTERLQRHLETVRRIHDQDLREGFGTVEMPDALGRKYPGAPKDWGWQYVFPASGRSRDPRGSEIRRHHIHESAIQKALKGAMRQARVYKHASCHTLRHSFATHLLMAGEHIRKIQDLMGHKHIETTMIYLHVIDQGQKVQSPLDRMAK
ncbi:MAG: integron integrase [Nitrospiraceae bacterium]|nr:integron integrase [Nitrospiraceae bacterium]